MTVHVLSRQICSSQLRYTQCSIQAYRVKLEPRFLCRWKQPTVRSQAADGAKSSAMEEEGDDERRAFAESFYNPDTSDDYVGTTTEDSSGGGEDNAIDRLAGED